MLDHQYQYDFQKDKTQCYRSKSIDQSSFMAWSKNNLYRTSYASHWTDKPLPPRNTNIPHYGGFVPKVIAQNEYGKSLSKVSREMLDDKCLGHNKTGLSSSGWNAVNFRHLDHSMHNTNQRYGQQTLPQPHPCLKEHNPLSNTHESFMHPSRRLNPTYRDSTAVNHSVQSGFNSNDLKCDGKGWQPHPVLDVKREHSEYRGIFNRPQELHRQTHKSVDRKLHPNVNTYFKA